MSLPRRAAITMAVAITLAGDSGLVRAQSSEPPSDAPVQAGSLTLSPTIQLTNFGHDSDVYNTGSDSNPIGGVTATLSPVVEAWLRSAHARVSGRSKVDFYYFKDHTDLNTVDADTAARVDVLLNRLSPYFTGTLTDTRHREDLQIDSLARRRAEGVTAGAYLRLTNNISVGGYTGRSRLEYEQNSLYLGTDLARQLNHTAALQGVGVRYALTTLTTFYVGIEREQDRFEVAANNNADSLRVSPAVEFNPKALVSGRAEIGFRKFTFLSGTVPQSNGTTASVDLNYTLLGQTRFGVRVNRDLEYSYLINNYLITEVDLTATARLGASWEVGGAVGRARLAYGQVGALTNLGATPDQGETAHTFAADARYRLNHAKIGVHVDYRTRRPDQPELFRGYERLRIGSTLTYTF